jgi:hypothetical protein
LAAIEKKHGKCENDKLFSTQWLNITRT